MTNKTEATSSDPPAELDGIVKEFEANLPNLDNFKIDISGLD